MFKEEEEGVSFCRDAKIHFLPHPAFALIAFFLSFFEGKESPHATVSPRRPPHGE
jgi:hypothetical protein